MNKSKSQVKLSSTKSKETKSKQPASRKTQATPLAVGSSQTNNGAHITHLPKGGIRVKHEEILFEAVCPPDGTTYPYEYPIQVVNAGNPFFAEWLSRIAQPFSKYLIHDLKVKWKPSCAATTTGSIMFAWDPNMEDIQEDISSRKIMQMEAAVEATVWQPAVMLMPSSVKNLTLFLNDQPSSPVGYDPRLSDNGFLRFLLPGAPASSGGTPFSGLLGRFYVSYDVSLITPEPEASEGIAYVAAYRPPTDSDGMYTWTLNGSNAAGGLFNSTGSLGPNTPGFTRPTIPNSYFSVVVGEDVDTLIQGQGGISNVFLSSEFYQIEEYRTAFDFFLHIFDVNDPSHFWSFNANDILGSNWHRLSSGFGFAIFVFNYYMSRNTLQLNGFNPGSVIGFFLTQVSRFTGTEGQLAYDIWQSCVSQPFGAVQLGWDFLFSGANYQTCIDGAGSLADGHALTIPGKVDQFHVRERRRNAISASEVQQFKRLSLTSEQTKRPDFLEILLKAQQRPPREVEADPVKWRERVERQLSVYNLSWGGSLEDTLRGVVKETVRKEINSSDHHIPSSASTSKVPNYTNKEPFFK